jgi:flagellar motor switch protein FliM
MAMADEILSQDELDALLDGVKSGSVDVDAPAAPGEVRHFDFARHALHAQRALPDLQPIHERCARHLRDTLLAQLRCNCEIAPTPARVSSFSDYTHSLALPACLHVLRANSVRGNALVAIEPALVYSFVDHFFGGAGRFRQAAGEREFSPAEHRVVQLVVQAMTAALAAAWLPVAPLEFELLRSESNPQLAAIAAADDGVVVAVLRIVIGEVEGAIHFVMPCAMLEPLREHFEVRTGVAASERDERWSAALREEVLDAEIELASNLVQTQIRIGDFVRLRPGDVIPIDLPDLVTLHAEQVPLFHTRFGTAAGNNAVRLLDAVGRRPRAPLPATKEIP